MSISTDPEVIAAEVGADVRRMQVRAECMSELAAVSEGVRGSAVSRGRDLVVEVDTSGRVTKLQIANQALSRGGTRIGAELMHLLGQAHQDAQSQMLHAATGLLGDDPVVETLRSDAIAGQGSGASEVRGVDVPRLGVSRTSGGLW